MSDAEQQVVTQEIVNPKRSCGWVAIWIVLFLILFGVFGILGYTKWLQLKQQLSELRETIKTSEKVETERWQPIKEKMSQLTGIQTTLQSEMQQQSTILSSMKEMASGNIDRWYVAEARYLVKLAQLETAVSRNYFLVNGYLEKAQAILQKIADPKVIEMRSMIKQDQEEVLKLSGTADISVQFEKLVALDKQIDLLRFPGEKIEAGMVSVQSLFPSTTHAWWTQGLDSSWRLLKEIVVVKKSVDNRPPFVLPDEKILLRANLHLQMQHAIEGLLRHEAKIYQSGLQQAIDWVSLYFKANDTITVSWLKEMATLKQLDLNARPLNVSHAVPLFDAYLNQ